MSHAWRKEAVGELDAPAPPASGKRGGREGGRREKRRKVRVNKQKSVRERETFGLVTGTSGHGGREDRIERLA